MRPGELRLGRWGEVDEKNATWIIPAERTKMRGEHAVPLPHQALGILRNLRDLTGWGELMFPSVRSSQRAMSDNTLNAALRRMGYGKEEMTAHGFRAMFSTLSNESGLWHPDAIERALARGQHWDERVKLAQWWADKLDQLRQD